MLLHDDGILDQYIISVSEKAKLLKQQPIFLMFMVTDLLFCH